MMSFHSRRALSAIFITTFFWSAAGADETDLTLPNDVGGTVRALLSGRAQPDDPSSYLQVFTGTPEACCVGKSPIAGRYRVDGQSVVFDPAFDFVAGQNYVVRSQKVGGKAVGTHKLTAFKIAPQNAPIPPEVTAIYPSGPNIPENTLRFYVHFSTPMAPHLSTEFIKLMGADGTADTAAFMTFKQELWNADRTRLTLLMDPGRIKRGVAQNLTLGPALLEANSYSIVVEGGWPSANGDQESPRFEHSFTVSGALRTLPDIALWEIQTPDVSTREPFVIHFDRPFDRSQAQTAITLLGDAGQTINGQVVIENHQRVWRFLPDTAWAAASVRMVVDARLEDVSGNNFRDLLDHSTDTDVLGIDQTSITVMLGPAPE